MSASTVTIPDYLAGTWAIDQVHSEVGFTTRHLGIAKVRGTFTDFGGTIVTAEDPLDSTVTATIQAGSFNTHNADRDAHVKSADFLDVDNHATLGFVSTGLRADGDEFVLTGDLTIRGVTKSVDFTLEFGGIIDSPFGHKALGLSATTTIKRTDFGVGEANPMVSDKTTITLEIEAAHQS